MHILPTKVLVIDDDPLVALSVRDAVPDWVVLEAADGADGMALVRRHHDLALVILDMQMPHDGMLTCIQIRRFASHIPILPFTGAAEHTDALLRLGCAPPLLKPASPTTIARAIADATGYPVSPLPHDPILGYLQQVAARSEQEATHAKRTAVRMVVFASSELVVNGLRSMLTAAGGTVRFATTDITTLRTVLREMRVTVLVADGAVYAAASALVQHHELALLVVAHTLGEGLRALDDQHSVIVEPVSTQMFATALAALGEGRAYQDERLHAPFAHTPLTKTECAIATLVLRGRDNKQIAAELTLQAETVRWHLGNICGKLGVADKEALRQWTGGR